ncbi:hypothetical protein [Ignavibacterium album]|uniref:hypothetical protein n=1 Tax=Ignavibacterium album TaxID=591197 RepID=UPI0026EA01F6|nr:hypothetical protein [Ignavibacterium album]
MSETENNQNQKSKKKFIQMGVGTALGVAIGAALNNIAIGLIIGITIGGLGILVSDSRKSKTDI